LAHTPVQKAHAKLRTMSADEEARHWAEAREKALRDEATLLAEALDNERRQTALNFLRETQLDTTTIARCTGLSEDEVRQLADEQSH
ncbi:hypothetical protein U5801_29110, partial [Lamprobacter modestohalophilus]|nr:hypothetical protein [Lamprobacter modestohalophilus]